ncbi:coagulation factor XII [Elgaria multicarinata webbii]|uniref:coagulation factor XII n=1 Tax=Elgaria multicarinata webbii TaxID=159646 RepID=UPI002FCCDFB8
MTSLLLLLLPLFALLLSPGEPFPDPHHKPPRREHEEHASHEEPCHFPFRYERIMHHSCIQSRARHQPWCATTENYDRDDKWRYCGKQERRIGHCVPNPCQNGGACEAWRTGFHCICTAGFHGRHCEKEGCFGARRQLHIGRKDTWLRYHPPTGLEECHCSRKKMLCKHIHGKACTTNPCLNGGHCTELKHSKVCGCPEGFSGPLCDIGHNQTCYIGNGHLYRGMAQSSLSGTPCLPWDSPFLHKEYSINSTNAASLGLGTHSFCRNPDNDSQPWCFVVKEQQFTWEFCNVTRCHLETAGDMAGTVLRPDLELKPANSDLTVSSVQVSRVPEAASAPLCGQRYPKVTSSTARLVGGMVALPASHPYMAAIYIGDQFCGGSLVTSCSILTAAHCFEQRPAVTSISVVLGQNKYKSEPEDSLKLQVQEYLMHENYSEATKQHDIALVRLKEKVSRHCTDFSRTISPVCLPEPKETTPDTSKNCKVAGWGHTMEGADNLATNLQEADIPILPQEQCRSQNVHGNRIMEGMLCAGYMHGMSDACQGDSGGPLVCEEQGQTILRGIVSWGTGCAQVNKPGVYTKVAQYLDWIKTKIY